MENIKSKAKIIAFLAVGFVVFATTFFALAENKNSHSLFLDSDQDGLTDQEEKMIGTDPMKADTDGDGYSDGKEVESGYDPLKPAPGDKLMAPASANSKKAASSSAAAANAQNTLPTGSESAGQTSSENLLASDAALDLSSDPKNPNLTNEMIGQLMQLTKEKASADSSFVENPTYSSEDYNQIAQKALASVDVAKSLPEISDSEIKVLPAINGKKLKPDELKAKQKSEIEKYLAQVAFVFVSNSPFPVEEMSSLQSNITSEGTSLISALSTGNQAAVEKYAQKAETGVEQLKKIEVPYVLKDIHKSMLQLSLYTLNLKGDIALNSTDPMKSLAAASTLQSVAEKATQTQEDLSQILNEYGIEFIKLP
jgi:hypothetical protein